MWLSQAVFKMMKKGCEIMAAPSVSPWLATEPSMLCSPAHTSCKFSVGEKMSIICFLRVWNTQGQIFSLTMQFRNCMDGSWGTVLDLSSGEQIWLHTYKRAMSGRTVSRSACILTYWACMLFCPGKIPFSLHIQYCKGPSFWYRACHSYMEALTGKVSAYGR